MTEFNFKNSIEGDLKLTKNSAEHCKDDPFDKNSGFQKDEWVTCILSSNAIFSFLINLFWILSTKTILRYSKGFISCVRHHQLKSRDNQFFQTSLTEMCKHRLKYFKTSQNMFERRLIIDYGLCSFCVCLSILWTEKASCFIHGSCTPSTHTTCMLFYTRATFWDETTNSFWDVTHVFFW